MSGDLHTPRHLLETLAVDQDLSHASEARQHVAGCETCASRLAEIARARAAHLAAYPAEDFARQVAARAAKARRPAIAGTGEGSFVDISRRRWLAGLGGLALALGAVALYVIPKRAPDEIRWKGSASWSVFAKRGARTWAVTEGETLKPGDQLAFTYSLAQDRFLLVLGVDDTGTVAQYGPAESLRLTRGQGPIPFAIELDARLGDEQLVGLFSVSPLDAAAAKQSLATAAVGARSQGRRVTAEDLKVSAEIVTFGFKKL